MLATAIFVALLLIESVTAGNSECSSRFEGAAIATFSGYSGVAGTVRIESSGTIMIDMSISDEFKSKVIDQVCRPGSGNAFQYHIHEFWNYNDRITDKFGPDACGSEKIGGHLNPYSVPMCNELQSNIKASFYNCEIGDLSGRFGLVTPDSKGNIKVTNYMMKDVKCAQSDCSRISPIHGHSRSINFHCSDGTRVFCAPFVVKKKEDIQQHFALLNSSYSVAINSSSSVVWFCIIAVVIICIGGVYYCKKNQTLKESVALLQEV